MPIPAAAVVAGGSLISSLIGGIFGSKAAKAQTRAIEAGIAEQRRQYDQSREDFAPWRQAGQGALGVMSRYYGWDTGTPDTSVFFNSPDYAFVRDEGLRAIDRQRSARGLLNSGAADKARMSFGSGLASSEFGNWWNRLAGVAGTGQAATGSTVAAGQATASNIGNLYGQMGNARASSYANTGSQINNGINNVLAAYLMGGQFGGGIPGMSGYGGGRWTPGIGGG